MAMQTPLSPLSFDKSFMKIRSAVPENGCLVFLWRTEKNKKKQKKTKNICKTYTLPPRRRLRKTTVKHVQTKKQYTVHSQKFCAPCADVSF